MGAKLKPGVSQVNVELKTELLDKAKEFAARRGLHLRDVVSRALERHLAYPPPLPPPPEPLPPCAPDPPPAKPARKPRTGRKP